MNSHFQTSLLLRARSNVMVTRGTVQNLKMRFMKITFVHGLNWTHVDAAVVAFFRIGYNMYNNKAQIKVECRHPKLDYDYSFLQPNKLES